MPVPIFSIELVYVELMAPQTRSLHRFRTSAERQLRRVQIDRAGHSIGGPHRAIRVAPIRRLGKRCERAMQLVVGVSRHRTGRLAAAHQQIDPKGSDFAPEHWLRVVYLRKGDLASFGIFPEACAVAAAREVSGHTVLCPSQALRRKSRGGACRGGIVGVETRTPDCEIERHLHISALRLGRERLR